MKVSVVVAMKDEEGSLPFLGRELGSLAALLARRGASLEPVLVDDGSGDGTAAAAESLLAAYPGSRLLRHERNRGFGAALRTGVAATTGDVVVSYDADCAYPAADVARLLDALDGRVDGVRADVATATPFAPGGEARAGWFRTLLSRGCSLVHRAALRGRGRGVRTFTCAFRAYRGDAIRALRWDADRFLAAAEILARCLLRGDRVVEVPSSLRPRFAGTSKMRVVRTAFGHLALAARIAVARRPDVPRTAAAPPPVVQASGAGTA